MDNNRNNKIEEILGSLDGCHKASMPDFFYTRLKARMENEIAPVATKRSWVLRPAFALTALAVVVVINAAVILKGDTGKQNTSSDSETMQSLAAEYRINDNNAILFDVNQDK